MKARTKKLVIGLALAPFVLAALAVLTVAIRKNRTFDAPLPDIHASRDPAVIERGRYLVFGPAHCGTCHGDSGRQTAAFSGEELPLSGGFLIDIPPGKFWAPNITPDDETGIGKVSDEMIARALRYGVGRDGRAIFPFMPFQNLSDEDLTAVISFLRAQAPVRKGVAARAMTTLGSIVLAFALEPEGPKGTPPAKVPIEPTAAYGKYLAHDVANCYGCHTDRDLRSGKFIGVPFAGGMVFDAFEKPNMEVVTPNLTPDPATGRMTGWSEEVFVQRIKSGVSIEGTHMPWGSLKRLTDDDARAIYRYLRSLPPTVRDNGPSLRPKKG